MSVVFKEKTESSYRTLLDLTLLEILGVSLKPVRTSLSPVLYYMGLNLKWIMEQYFFC